MTFNQAMLQLRKGDRVTRAAWPADCWLWQDEAHTSGPLYGYRYTIKHTPRWEESPWVGTQEDLNAEDWNVTHA